MEIFDWVDDDNIDRPLTFTERTILKAVGILIVWGGKRIMKLKTTKEALKLRDKIEGFIDGLEEKYSDDEDLEFNADKLTVDIEEFVKE